ncbi:Bacterial alpha-L-rhamnosidase [Botrimarina colliarenosi]|uniref:alpha-L-rhamnosidase n=1 Tax=Botrimarina colliarenosi TaxID=2528001 RepID=A0A5C6ADA3_9BACT|nr:alpha-L-rhamnosidase [Botrimarina colliarenosi]TWT97589.1 Bacterial alpha-L-rhamnosidase [Botrimarina colliarenosi]
MPRLVLRNCTTAILVFCAAGVSASAAIAQEGLLEADRLRCEYRNEPLGVDSASPKLSWIVVSETPGQFQTAYQVQVASSPQKLRNSEADLWDSGKTPGGSTYDVTYEGATLASHQRCYWRVRTWDVDGLQGPWSDPAEWSMGVLDPSEWEGEWIGYDALRHLNSDPPTIDLEDAQWVGLPEDVDHGAPAGATRLFERTWTLPATGRIERAQLMVCADDQATVLLNGYEVASVSSLGNPTVESVAPYLEGGPNTLRVLTRNGDQGPTGLAVKLRVTTEEGTEHVLVTDGEWRCVADGDEPWKNRSLDKAPQAAVVTAYGNPPYGRHVVRRDVSAPPSYLRGEFKINKPVRRATVYLAALGLADLTLNGQRVNTDYFSSGWTDYRKRVYYRAYDVTEAVLQGENAWGAVLADGWYSGHIAWGAARDIYGKKPRFRAMLRAEYDDGSTEVFSTDRDWIATDGPVQVADFLVGEEYDARKEAPGWDRPDGSPVRLASADVGAEYKPVIEWHPGPPVVEVAEFPAESVDEPAPGVYVYDVGQNMAGVARIKVQGRKGQRIQIRFAERTNPDGSIYTTNLRLARATDVYTCKGDGVEEWQPRQTFHGFQYVELTGIDEPLPLDQVTAVALSSDTPDASEFECSDEKLNRLYKNILWTQRSNFIDVPTDCPQRDERLGWTGDAQVYVMTACLTADTQAFFRKWLVDLADAQRDDGQFPKVAPVVRGQDDGGPAWADAGVICPWEVYWAYGDIELLRRQYPSMVRFVEFCRERSRDGVLPPDQYHAFGDWLDVNAPTPKEVIYTAYYARSVDLLRRSAEVLGETTDAAKYADLFDRIRAAFVEEYVSDEGEVRGDTQTGYVLAISYGLLDGPLREKAAKKLVQNIEARGWKLSTGFIGTKDLMLTLSQIGRHDVALRLLHQTEYPGWLFSIAHGATSIWERWDGWTPEHGFQNPGMNSFAHYSFGAVYGWMAQNLGGIHAVSPGYADVLIEPTFDPQLDWCRVEYDSVRGPIRTEWNTTKGERSYSITIPANTQATLRLRNVEGSALRQKGEPVATTRATSTAAGIDATEIDLSPGRHKFTIIEGE